MPMHQLTLPLPARRRHPVRAVLAKARALGWAPDAMSRAGRWWLPGTPYRLTVGDWYVMIYRLEARQALQAQRYRLTDQGAIHARLAYLAQLPRGAQEG